MRRVRNHHVQGTSRQEVTPIKWFGCFSAVLMALAAAIVFVLSLTHAG
jgi:hypothetical protein